MDAAEKVMARARRAATRLRHDFIGTEHLLLALLEAPENEATAALKRLGVDLARLQHAVEENAPIGKTVSDASQLPFTPRTKRALEEAMGIAMELQDDHVGCEHLLLGLLAEGEGVAARALASLGVDLEGLRAAVAAARKAGDERGS
jgi:ATP-dependent Clp protease ATP-binding subunit ClpC